MSRTISINNKSRLIFRRDARSRQALNFTVHERIEYTPPQHHSSEPEDLLSDIVKAVLPFIQKLRDILRNPIKVILLNYRLNRLLSKLNSNFYRRTLLS